MTCPSCNAPMADGALECPSCGVIVGKWRQRTEGGAKKAPPRAAAPHAAAPQVTRIVAASVIGAVLLIGGYWYFSIRPRARAIEDPNFGNEPGRAKTLKQQPGHGAGFDAAFKLPGSPLGVATDGTELIVGNRTDPWGAIRLKPSGKDRLTAQQVPITEPRYNQRINLNALTWNGKQYVGLTTGSWFQKEGEVFTIHDSKTLRLVDWKPAPLLVGCLAWDGQSYWAATRRHTADSPEPALLYHLDAEFNVLSSVESPGVGCQGLTWDGKYLWYVDVFSDSIKVIDVSGGSARIVHNESTERSYLSGVVAFDGDIWVTDYDDNVLQRLDPAVRVAWAGGTTERAPTGFVAAAAVPAAGADVEALRRQLRSSSWSDRMRAEMELQRLGASIDFDRDENHFVDRKPDDTEVIDWSVELRNGSLYGSWKLWYGADLFQRHEQSGPITLPQFARYTVSVYPPGGAKVEKEFDATTGENVMNDVLLASASASGEYRVEMFLHVQYAGADGQGKILNRSTTSLTVKQ